MFNADEIEKEIRALEKELEDRVAALPAHSVRPQQIILIEELELRIEKKRNELAELAGSKFHGA